MHYFGVKTLSETLVFPPLMHLGYGARLLDKHDVTTETQYADARRARK